MLVYSSKLMGTPVLSLQTGAPIGYVAKAIINPEDLQIIALELNGPIISESNLLDTSSIREYSTYGIVVDSIDELISPEDVIKISEIMQLNFNLINLKVETKKGSKLGHIIDYTISSDNLLVQQLIVKRPLIKSLVDPELTIPRAEIIEISDYKIIIKDEVKTIKEKSTKEEFVPNFVNPFRNQEQGFVPADTKTPDAQDN